jgi:hypothetical protein
MYEAKISRRNPGCILLLLDQSESMNDSFAGDPAVSKAIFAANAVNELILEIVLSCQAEPGRAYHYFDLGIIGYGAGGASFGWRGIERNQGLLPVSAVRDNVLRIEERTISDGAGVIAELKARFPVWLDPVAQNGAPMAEALAVASDALWEWATSHPDSFPPMVFLVTGGQADPVSFAGAEPFIWAERLKNLATRDGTLLFHSIYLSSAYAVSTLFPGTSDELPDDIAQTLFDMSSAMPKIFKWNLKSVGYVLQPDARGFAVNANITPLIRAIDIGTRVGIVDDDYLWLAPAAQAALAGGCFQGRP